LQAGPDAGGVAALGGSQGVNGGGKVAGAA
jgi:hypothetical protein